ncbi:hypothetical protein EHO98_22745 [Leptospira stimsonii]|uniref:Uncharacterized protein n=1 Tax=Leptospira stimsonii TaxID=2202203 RepID=A0ABY2N9L4_9LEPT|nr:hypothetical protein EHO98_22745 [Leptospira stimsonii]TGM18981.1 hypothetical protein EHQ90_05525 [Leptospira stimsonii]
MDSKSLHQRKLRNRFPLLTVSRQCSNFNLKCERLEYKHSKQSNSPSFMTWNRCFIINAKSLFSYLVQYTGNRNRTAKERIWNQFANVIVGRLNTYNTKDRLGIRVQVIVDKINRDSKRLTEGRFHKPEFKKTFHRQATKLNQFKGTFNPLNEESAVHNWTYCMGQNCTHIKNAEKILQRRHDPGWDWFITVKCDYFFGDRNPVWDGPAHTLIGNFNRTTRFQESGEHSGIYR